ncbi:hypothetical protein [Sulfurimonas indica]|uniref:hypothetical protein n=1 Tax=Sulfurimonas indica TaxID=2508707 RepID=UPI001265490E|nr:hypothetical protein [Sulfurimonas indica]
MKVVQYTFQSPYPSSMQVGRLDPNSVKDDNTKNSSQGFNAQNETVQKAKIVQESLKQEVKPTLSSNQLDIYA